MKQAEYIERGLSIDENRKVLDEYGNEYRNESGEVEYLELEPLTAEQKAEYPASGGKLCPFCKGSDITTTDPPEVTDDGVTQDIECENCGAEWRDVYTLTKRRRY